MLLGLNDAEQAALRTALAEHRRASSTSLARSTRQPAGSHRCARARRCVQLRRAAARPARSVTWPTASSADRHRRPGHRRARAVRRQEPASAGTRPAHRHTRPARPARWRPSLDPGHRPSSPDPASDIMLTIDRSIQFDRGGGTARPGRLAQRPSGYGDRDRHQHRRGAGARQCPAHDEDEVEITAGNFAAVKAYEPGSVAKVVQRPSPAFNQGSVTPDSTFPSCRGAASTPMTS